MMLAQFMSGTAPPALQELGPYTFTVRPLTVQRSTPALRAPVDNSRCCMPSALTNRCTMQAHTVNYNINFTYNYTDVAYHYYSYQEFNASASCKGCSLNDSFIGINRHPRRNGSHKSGWFGAPDFQSMCARRAYQNLLTTTGESEYPAVLQLAPALLGGVIGTLETAFAPVRAQCCRRSLTT